MSNHLLGVTSPYLLQHAGNPVDWYPWGQDALTRARTENKPIFLSIGYAACHWCHVMAHESFEDAETAAFMNDNFICIKVDREERPDLDSIYMQATMALTSAGGWPMSIFLTSELRPFYAGTYFPPVRRYNMPSFKEVLLGITRLWAEDQAEVNRVSERVTNHIQPPDDSTGTGIFSRKTLEASTKFLLDSYDWEYGSWGSAPKFPQPMTIDFLLRRAITGAPLHEQALEAALHTLKAMARGGMYDVVGGGFARYSTDNLWLIPHFEKMLYDNALLARAYLHAWQITREPFYIQIATETLDFVSRELTDPRGGFYSSLDADSEGEEGKFYLWTTQQIKEALWRHGDFELFAAAYGLTDKGNWDGQTILQRTIDNATLSDRFKMDPERVVAKLVDSRSELLSSREKRIRPSTDDKILTAWNGLMLQTFAEASRVLDDPHKAAQYLGVATRNADFLLFTLQPNGELRRGWRNGTATSEVFLEDFAALALGLLELYQTDFDNRWFIGAQQIIDEIIRRFSDSRGGFYDTPRDAEALLIRPKDIQDNATPSGNALACEALLRLTALTDNGEYRDLAEKGLKLVSDAALRFPTAFARWLACADYALADSKQIAVLFKKDIANAAPLLNVIRSQYRPTVVVAASAYPPPDTAPTLLQHRFLKGGKTTAYVCEHFSCKRPVNSEQELLKQL